LDKDKNFWKTCYMCLNSYSVIWHCHLCKEKVCQNCSDYNDNKVVVTCNKCRLKGKHMGEMKDFLEKAIAANTEEKVNELGEKVTEFPELGITLRSCEIPAGEKHIKISKSAFDATVEEMENSGDIIDHMKPTKDERREEAVQSLRDLADSWREIGKKDPIGDYP